MTDPSKVLTVLALVLLFVVTMQLTQGGLAGGIQLPTGVWVGLGVAFYFGVIKRGGYCIKACPVDTR